MRVVICGNANLQEKLDYWKNYFERHDYEIMDYPRIVNDTKKLELYPAIREEFYGNIKLSKVLFIMNEDYKDITGYIGSETFAELAYGLALKLVDKKDIDLVLLKMPSEKVACYEDIKLWLDLGWIRLFEEEI
ncbi:MAG: hypothetical protein OSJ70_06855 [Bacilli bacterium]|mgnify:CR=1 FL=1|nr:hypothetical protein [Bacilli bacterium]